jgi:PAS domain S-box-containing protein
MLLIAQKRALEMVARGESLTAILEELCDAIDAQSPGIISFVMLVDPDGKHQRPAAGKRMPSELASALGSCPIAADFRDWALSRGLQLAWSQPILAKNGELLGTLGMCNVDAYIPSTSDFELLEAALHVAVIAIEGERAAAAQQGSEERFRGMADAVAEEKLRLNEQRLRDVIETIPAMAWSTFPDGKVDFANTRWAEYTGPALRDMSGLGWKTAIHPADFDAYQEKCHVSLDTGKSFESEVRIRRFSDGEYRWFLNRAVALRGEHGEIVGWYGTATDIEDSKRASAALETAFAEIKKLKDQLVEENILLKEEIDRASMFEEIVGESPTLQVVLSRVAKVAPIDSTVLVTGETGTGKELIARAIHRRSPRATRAFVSVNCSAIPPSLIASELFGHEKGAFTGAIQRRLGRFELADGGTIFLDEIGELCQETQIALLRVLQEREFERVGGSKVIRSNVRVIAATNRDLTAAVEAGSFRSDLYYRLNVFPVHMPSLRERRDDIPLLVEYFIGRYAAKAGKEFGTISKATLERLCSYDWPGNVRELQNVIERSVIVCDTENFVVDKSWLAPRIAETDQAVRPLLKMSASQEKKLIEDALAETQGRVAGASGAAAKLGIPPSTLDSKIAAFKINKHQFKRI